jgi:hypothetical protein
MTPVRIPRWCHHLYANMRGYFWLPCAAGCGRMVGGHETVRVENGTVKGVCSKGCYEEQHRGVHE